MLAFWPTINAEMPRWALLALGIPLVSRLDPRAVGIPLFCSSIALLGYAGLTLVWSSDPLGGANQLFHLVILALAVLAAAQLASIDVVMTWIAAGLAVSAALVVPQMLGWGAIPQFSVPAGLFFNRDVLAETAAPVFLWAAARRDWFLAPVLSVPLLLCQSRVALFAVLVGLLVVWRAPPMTKFLGAVLAGIFATASILLFGPEKFTTALDRIEIWQAAALSIAPFGHGLGWFGATYPRWEYAHSDLLQAAVEIGAVPLLLAAGICAMLWRRWVRVTPASDGATNGALAAALVCAVFSFPLELPASGFVFAVLASRLARNGLRLRGKLEPRRVADRWDFWPAVFTRRDREDSRSGGFGLPVRPASAPLCGIVEAGIGGSGEA